MQILQQQKWARDAACAQADPEPFHPVKRTRRADVAAAKALCRTCPVAAECLSDALARADEFGIWGGLDEHERREARKQQRSRRLPTPEPTALTPEPTWTRMHRDDQIYKLRQDQQAWG